jgi:hypothetical protein
MSNGAHWVTARIAEARKRHASVTEAVATRMEELLSGELSERQLRPAELVHHAKALIVDMATPAAPKAEAKQ